MMPTDYYARLEGVVSARFLEQSILAVGCGAGSEMLLRLARLGPRRIILVDPDVVEAPNLTRTAYGVGDLGRPKVAALADRIREANPFVDVRAEPVRVEALDPEELLAEVDLIIAGTDAFAAQALLNTWSTTYRIPAVFIGIHERARGGLLIWTIPGETPCYRCAVPERYRAEEQRGEAALALPGAHGAMVDIAFVDAIALKLVVALLERGMASEFGSFIARSGDRTQVVVRMHPRYTWGAVDLFQLILSDLPNAPVPYQQQLEEEAFFCMDSLWLRAEFDPACPDCGHLQGWERFGEVPRG